MFTKAIVKTPSPKIVNGLSSANLGRPDYQTAASQHLNYIKTLRICGLEVRVLESDESLPDSVFIEDVALCTPGCSVITNPGAASRQQETKGFRKILEEFYDSIEEIFYPGTLEAGDVMMVDNHYFIGISERTNIEGAEQLINILAKYEMTGSKVPLEKMLHLKSGVSYLENNNILVCNQMANRTEFAGFNRIEVDEDENYAANSLWINGKVIVPDGFPKTRWKIENAGYDTITVDVSEFRKVDGGLSCLSLRF